MFLSAPLIIILSVIRKQDVQFLTNFNFSKYRKLLNVKKVLQIHEVELHARLRLVERM